MRVLRLSVDWSQIAPATRPANFDPSNPDDPAYDWSSADEAITSTVDAGFEPILDVFGAPAWAAQAPAFVRSDNYPLGPLAPVASALEEFATAIARRYDGVSDGLPRVRYWQLYNEPNLDQNLRPQVVGSRLVSPGPGALRSERMRRK